MNKELQDLAWSCLPKEFKEEVKFEYLRVATKVIKSNYDLGFMNAHEGMYGIHNLTSDAEGEETLYVSRKTVQEMYVDAVNNIRDYNGDNSEKGGIIDPILRERAVGMKAQLRRLFGSKCLPDDPQEFKPSMPKFKRRDKVIIVSSGKVCTIEDTYCASRWLYLVDGLWVFESDLEPYTEPDTSHETPVCENHSDNTSQKEVNVNSNRNLSQEIANCDKEFDTILKDSVSKERRLNVATQIMHGILCNQKMLNNLANGETTVEGVVKCIVDATMMYTDALIAECESSAQPLCHAKKGGAK